MFVGGRSLTHGIMPLPFHWLFDRERWNRNAYTDERFVSLISELLEYGMSKRDIENAFQRWFGIKLGFRGAKLNIDENAALKVRKRFGQISDRFFWFRQRGLSFEEDCTREEAQRIARREDKESLPSAPRVGSNNQMGYMAGAVVFGLLGIVFWPLLILAAVCLFLFFFAGVFNFDPLEDGKKVEGFGILDGLPIGCAIPIVVIAIILFLVAMANK